VVNQSNQKFNFNTYSLNSCSWGERVERVLNTALIAADPYLAVRRVLDCQGNELFFGEKAYHLDLIQRIRLLSFGKASIPMAKAVVDSLPGRYVDGLVVTKAGYQNRGHRNFSGTISGRKIEYLEAAHPVPDETSIFAGQKVIDFLANGKPEDLVICLISGGGSALLYSPNRGISLDDLQQLTKQLLACGASIHEINILRKHLDHLKGGGLARLVYPAQLITLVLSDVVGDSLDIIASGPTLPDPSTFSEALHILKNYSLEAKIPRSIIDYLSFGSNGAVAETPKPGDPFFENSPVILVGSNLLSAEAALIQAKREGFEPLLLTTKLQGEARQAGLFLGAIACQAATSSYPLPRPACLIVGGETTVTLLGDGLGGRNQEIALGAVAEMAGLKDTAFITLATDGDDGPTDAAGAVVTGFTFERARELHMEPGAYLQRNDSYHFFQSLDDLLKPGPTHTNVNDLAFIFTF
jgi:glycerate 2-kinase